MKVAPEWKDNKQHGNALHQFLLEILVHLLSSPVFPLSPLI